MNCPWCGKEMSQGKLVMSPKNAYPAIWESTDRDFNKLERFFGDHRKRIRGVPGSEPFSCEGKIPAHHCPGCKKFIFDGWVDKF